MKKKLAVVIFALVLSFCTFAAEKDESKWSSMTYVNIPVLKVLDARNGYLVIYQKNKVGVGSVVIPKDWIKGSEDSPRKLKLRKVRRSMDSYMTIIKEDGEFKRVVLNLPMNKQNSIWGVVKNPNELQGTDKDTLEDIEL